MYQAIILKSDGGLLLIEWKQIWMKFEYKHTAIVLIWKCRLRHGYRFVAASMCL